MWFFIQYSLPDGQRQSKKYGYSHKNITLFLAKALNFFRYDDDGTKSDDYEQEI